MAQLDPSATLDALDQVGIDSGFNHREVILEHLTNARFTAYPALAQALLTLLAGRRLRRQVSLAVIAFNYEHSPGEPSPRQVEQVDVALLKVCVVQGFNTRYGESVTNFDDLLTGPGDDQPKPSGIKLSLVRGVDLLVAEFEVLHMRISADGTHLEKEPSGDAQIVVRLPPQHINEQALPSEALVVGHTASFLAGRTVLSFSVNGDRIPLTPAGLLDPALISPLIVPPDTAPDPGEVSVFLGKLRTAIEFPSRLLLTPDESATWRHRDAPFLGPDGRTEIWHTRLVSADGGPAKLRAYARIERLEREGSPLSKSNLSAFVGLTSTNITGTFARYQARPMDAELMMLSALGASVRMRAVWEYPDPIPQELLDRGFPNTNVTQYEHIASLGRDSYVKVVHRGCLHTGHRSVVFKVTERTFEVHPDAGPPAIALLRQQFILVVQEPEQVYDDMGYPFAGREMPLRSLRFLDTVTPPLSDVSGTEIFWVQVRGADHKLNAVATDLEGNQINVSIPVMFIPSTKSAAEAIDKFAGAPLERRQWVLSGQTMAMAKTDVRGEAGHPTQSIELKMVQVRNHLLGALPMVDKASVRLPVLEQLVGTHEAHPVRFHEKYLKDGLGSTAAGVFLKLDPFVPVGFSQDRVGGVAKPNGKVEDITTRAGILPSAFTDGEVTADKLASVFGDEAKILGNIPLAKFLKATGPLDISAFPTTPEAVRAVLADETKRLPAPIMLARPLAGGGGTEVRYVWRPPLEEKSGDLPLRFPPGSSLTLDALTVRAADGSVTSKVTGELRNFRFELDVVAVKVDKLTFVAEPGRKPTVDITGLEIDFGGALQFINTLRRLFPANGFGAGTLVNVTPAGIEAGYSLAVPSVSVGVFALSNLALSAKLTIPFDDRPAAFRFAISERHDPFNVSVGIFGGGGFFALVAGAKGIEQIEGAIEFGGSASLNLGIASGGIYLMGGIYFSWSQNAMSLTGYLRAGGHLSVLGIVTVSVEFRMMLGYRKNGRLSEMYGRATVTVSVKIAFFSKSVSLSLERSFAGDAGDPSFADCIQIPDWHAICQAYA